MAEGEAYGAADKAAAPAVLMPCWQEFFADAKMREVIALALENNRDLRIAALNVERARALYGIQRAELFPTLSATGNGLRKRVPADLRRRARP